MISELNTAPALPPVNAWPEPSPAPTHDSVPRRLATPYRVEELPLQCSARFVLALLAVLSFVWSLVLVGLLRWIAGLMASATSVRTATSNSNGVRSQIEPTRAKASRDERAPTKATSMGLRGDSAMALVCPRRCAAPTSPCLRVRRCAIACQGAVALRVLTPGRGRRSIRGRPGTRGSRRAAPRGSAAS